MEDDQDSFYKDAIRVLNHEFSYDELTGLSGYLHCLSDEEALDACNNLLEVLSALTAWVERDALAAWVGRLAKTNDKQD